MSRRAVRILSLLPDFDLGGGQVILHRTIESLADDHDEHLVVAFDGGPLLETYRRAGIRCEVIGDGTPASWPAALRRLVAIVRSERIDVMLSLNTPLDRTMAQLCAAVTGRPVVVWFMSRAIPLIPFPPPPSRIPAFVKRLVLYPFNYLSVRRLAVRAVTSAEVARTFADHLRLSTDDFVIVPPGLPDEAFDRRLDEARRLELRTELDVVDADPLLVNVGMLIPLKGQRQLIEMLEFAADDLPGAHLLLVGDGPDRQALVERIAGSPVADRVHLLGHRHDVPELLCIADGLLSASASEGFGMSVLEAMAASLPVIAVRTPAFLEFVEEGDSAALVDHQDGAQLAEALCRVFGAPGRARVMGRRGRELAEHYRIESRARALHAVLGAVAGRPSLGRRSISRLRRRFRRGRGSGIVTVAEGPGRGLRLSGKRASADYTRPPERPVQELLGERLGDGDVFYDVGANVGFFSLLASRFVGPRGKVIAFEPVPANAAELVENADMNGSGNIEVLTIAVGCGARRGQLLLGRHPGGATLDAAAVPHDLVGATDVEIDSIDHLIATGSCPPPDMVKIDVEGTETEVLDGMTETLRRHRPLLVIEVDAPRAVEAEQRADELERRLAEAGYGTHRLEEGYPGIDWAVIHLMAEPT
jgi:FkbM family methyltransferase